MPLLTNGDLAKELIRRRSSQPAPIPASAPDPAYAQRPPPSTTNPNSTTSYDMVDQLSHNPGQSPLAGLSGRQIQTKRFWRLSRYRQAQGAAAGMADEGERRVVSEPLGSDGARAGGIFGRLRSRKASDNGVLVGDDESGELEGSNPDEGAVTDVTEGQTPADFSDLGQETSSGSHDEPSGERRDPSETGPSFISFSPVPSTRSSHRPPPREAVSQSGHSMRTLAPVFTTPDGVSRSRAAAIRAITLEARLAPDSSNASSDSCAPDGSSVEYPSLVDVGRGDQSSGVRGILRARHHRVPPNTPTPTVRFADTWLPSSLRRPRASVTVTPTTITEGKENSLPAAQISGGPRWRRLGAILSAVDRSPIPASTTPAPLMSSTDDLEAETPALSGNSGSFPSSDSPISFARFDPSEITSSTPVRAFKTLCVHPLDDTLSSPTPSTPSPPLSDSPLPIRTLIRRQSEEETAFEGCSALEALWEYGSSDGASVTGSLLELDVDPLSPDLLVTPRIDVQTDETVASAGTGASQHERGSGGLLPLKYRGPSTWLEAGQLYLGHEYI